MTLDLSVDEVLPEPVVELRDVTRRFDGPPAVEALRAVNLRVERGDYVSIVGPSGSGKSSLLNVLGLLDRPTSGEYTLDGRSAGTASERERARLRATRIGFVFQSFHLLPQRTVLENVVLATMYSGVPRGQRARRARAALDRVSLSHRLGFLPTTLSGSLARSSPNRTCCSPTSRRATSTRPAPGRSWHCSTSCTPTG